MRLWLTAAAAALLAPAAYADTLTDALTAAYQHNPTLLGARLSARSADEERAQARALYLPTLDLDAAAGVSESTVNGVDIGDRDPSGVGLTATQSLYTGGFRGARGRLARATVESAREGLRGTEQDVLLSVIAAYVDVQRDTEVVSIRQNNVEVLQRQEEEAGARFEVGDVTRTDVAQAGARLSGAQSGLTVALAGLEASKARYVQLVGVIPENLEAPPMPPDIPRTLDEAVDQALSLNPLLRQTRQGEQIARAQTGIERSALLPQVAVVGRYDNDDNGAPGLAGIETEAVAATAQVTVPLFEGGLARARVRQARINEARAEQETEEARRAVVSSVTEAWNNYIGLQRVVESSRAQVQANELAFEGVQAERGVGLRTTLDVLNAQQELLESRVLLVTAQRNVYVGTHTLLASIGRLDGAVMGVNAPLYDPAEHSRAASRQLLSTQPADIPLRGR